MILCHTKTYMQLAKLICLEKSGVRRGNPASKITPVFRLSCAIATSFSILTAKPADAKPAKLKYTGAFPPENGCFLPAVDSTTVGKRVVDMFAKIQHGQTLQQVRSQIDLAPIVPKLYKSKYFPQTTLGYEVPVADNVVIYPEVTFNQNLTVLRKNSPSMYSWEGMNCGQYS